MSTEVHADRLIAALRGALGARLVTFHNSLLSEVRPTTGDLILGFAFGYPPEVLSPFVESVRSDGKFDGKIVLFVNSSSQEVIEYLKEREIEPFAFDPSKSLMPSIFLARFFTYYEYLRDQWANGNVFNQILLTDVRDVIFQKRLFGTACDTLEFHLEEAFPTIGDCPNNSKWMKQVFGKEALSAFATKTISCAGTVCGRTIGILDYLTQVQLLALQLPEKVQARYGTDQCIHNCILYRGLTRVAIARPNFTRVATLYNVTRNSLRSDAEGRVINPRGDISEIAHQWDVHTELNDKIHRTAFQRRAARRPGA